MAIDNKSTLNEADLNKFPAAMAAVQLGSIVAGGTGRRIFTEVVPVAAAAAVTTYKVVRLLYARTIGTGAAGEKICDPAATAPGAGHAAPTAAAGSPTTGLTFNAETTGTGTAEVTYLTDDPPLLANGVTPAAKMSDAPAGGY